MLGLGNGLTRPRYFNGEFSPLSLFKNNEQGVWYDPSDFARYMSQLGSETIVNGDFSNGATGWNLGAGWTVSGGQALHSSVSGAGQITRNNAIVNNKWYKVEFDRIDTENSSMNAVFGSTFITVTAGAGRKSVVGFSTGVNFGIQGSGNYIVDNISVKELTAINTCSLFQDSLGTTPVTAVEQPVGLMLDRSKGSATTTIYTDNCDSFAGWTNIIGVGTSVGGRIRITRPSDNNIGRASKPFTCVVGNTYKLTIERYNGTTSNTSSSVGIATSSTSIGGALIDSSITTQGTYTAFFTATQTTHWIFLMTTTGANIGDYCEFDNIVITEHLGTHAIQPTAINRPILRNRYNLITNSELLSNVAWVRSGLTVTTSGNGTSPTGTTNVNKFNEDPINASKRVRHQLAGSTNAPYSVMLYAKASERSSVWVGSGDNGTGAVVFNLANGTITLQDVNVTSASIESVGNGWYLCKCTLTLTPSGPFIGIYNGAYIYQGVTGSGIFIWGVDVSHVAHANLPYQMIDTATTYDSDVTKFPLYLEANGTNSTMRTATDLNVSESDKVMVLAGVTKTATVDGIICELSVTQVNNAGTFQLRSSLAGSANYMFGSRGTTGAVLVTSGNNYNAPTTDILCGQGDISAPLTRLRVDSGLEVQTSTASQGTGNFGRFPLFIFGRNNGAPFFNGRLYGLIVRGTSTSDSDRTKAEKFMSKKSGL